MGLSLPVGVELPLNDDRSPLGDGFGDTLDKDVGESAAEALPGRKVVDAETLLELTFALELPVLEGEERAEDEGGREDVILEEKVAGATVLLALELSPGEALAQVLIV